MRQLLHRHFVQLQIVAADAETFKPLEIKFDPLVYQVKMLRVGPHEVLHLHLLKLARAQNEISRRDLVAERLADLRNSVGQLAAASPSAR